METNPEDAIATLPVLKKGDARVLAIIAMAFTAMNICISLIVFQDLFPMSIYPASIAFIITWQSIKEHLPTKKQIVIFVCIYQVVIIIGCYALAMKNGLAVFDATKFLEPVFFVPLVYLIILLASAMNHRQVIPRIYFACGAAFVVIAVFSLIPGNMVIALMESQGKNYTLIDAVVPTTLVIELYTWYHVPFILLGAGCAMFLIGYIALFTKKKINNIYIMATILGIVLSLYVIGFSLTWLLLQRSQDATFDGS